MSTTEALSSQTKLSSGVNPDHLDPGPVRNRHWRRRAVLPYSRRLWRVDPDPADAGAGLSHRLLLPPRWPELCLSGVMSRSITETVEEHFGKTGGVVITFLYFFAICPLLWFSKRHDHQYLYDVLGEPAADAGSEPRGWWRCSCCC